MAILVYEPQCKGNEHADINAALIVFLTKTKNSEGLIFFGESSHLTCIQNAIKSAGFSNIISSITWREIMVSKSSSNLIRRSIKELLNTLFIFLVSLLNKNTRAIIILSSTSATLLGVNLLHKLINAPILIVLHGILETIAEKPSGLIKRLTWFRHYLSIQRKGRVGFLTTADFIKSNLIQEIPLLEGRVFSLQFPYLFSTENPNHQGSFSSLGSGANGIINFTSAGVGTFKKGTDNFFDLSNKIGTNFPGASHFVHVGKLGDKELNKCLSDHVEVYGNSEMLSGREYRSILSRANFLVFFYPGDSYQFGVSGVLLDAIKYEIPIIAIGNDLFFYCQKIIGDIGWICDSVAEVESVVRSILLKPPIDRVKLIRENYRIFKQELKPSSQGAHLEKILTNV